MCGYLSRMRVVRSVLMSVAVLFLLLLADIFIETNIPIVKTVVLESSKIPSGSSLKILQISDLHGKEFGRDNALLLNRVKSSNADMIVITGDLIDAKSHSYEGVYSLIEKLARINPAIYFVSGNHEHWNPKSDELIGSISSLGVGILNGTSVRFKKGDQEYNVCGIDFLYVNKGGEARYYGGRNGLEKPFRGIDTRKYTVFLSHSPKIVEQYKKVPADLVLSGHTHGGQVRLPLVGSAVRLDPGFFSKFDRGLFDLGSGTMMYVDSGVGTSIIPVRLFCRSQISLIEIRGGDN